MSHHPRSSMSEQPLTVYDLTQGKLVAKRFEVVRAHKSQIDACVEAQKAVTPDESGRLVMRWTVESDGRVSDVSAASGEMSKSALSECLAKAIAGWTFPKHAITHSPVEVPFKY